MFSYYNTAPCDLFPMLKVGVMGEGAGLMLGQEISFSTLQWEVGDYRAPESLGHISLALAFSTKKPLNWVFLALSTSDCSLAF